jgi:hypothetical protein
LGGERRDGLKGAFPFPMDRNTIYTCVKRVPVVGVDFQTYPFVDVILFVCVCVCYYFSFSFLGVFFDQKHLSWSLLF